MLEEGEVEADSWSIVVVLLDPCEGPWFFANCMFLSILFGLLQVGLLRLFGQVDEQIVDLVIFASFHASYLIIFK